MLKPKLKIKVKHFIVALILVFSIGLMASTLTLNPSFIYNYFRNDTSLTNTWILVNKWQPNDENHSYMKLSLDSDRNLTLFDGCNAFFYGNYILNEEKVTFTDKVSGFIPPSTLMNYCRNQADPASIQAYNVILKELNTAHSYDISGNTLTITMNSGSTLKLVKLDDYENSYSWVKLYLQIFE